MTLALIVLANALAGALSVFAAAALTLGVLAGLVKRIEKGRDTQILSLDSPDSIQSAS